MNDRLLAADQRMAQLHARVATEIEAADRRMADAHERALAQLGADGADRLEARMDESFVALARARAQIEWALIALDLGDHTALIRHQRGIVADLDTFARRLVGECGGRRAGERIAERIALAATNMLAGARRLKRELVAADLYDQLVDISGTVDVLDVSLMTHDLAGRGAQLGEGVLEFRPRALVRPRDKRKAKR